MSDIVPKIIADLGVTFKSANESIAAFEARLAKLKQEVANTNLVIPVNTGTTGALTAQQAMVNQITSQGETRRAAIIAESEAKISNIFAKEALTRQSIVQKEAATELAIIKKQIEQEKLLYMQARRAAFEDKPQGLAGLMERRLSWLGTGALVLGGTAGIGEVVSTIDQVEAGMTTIARVTEDVTFNFKGMRDELQQLGVTYGDVWEKTEDVATKWAQAGYDMDETATLVRDSLLAMNTAELNSTQATSGLIAIMAQWGLTTEELLPTIDKINKVADDYAVTSTDLVDGLNRSSGAAKVLGLTLEETIALLTTMREASGRTGKETGNALNSILSFMQRPSAIKAFETEGIQVFADEARTQFRNVINIFDEMAQKWPQMGEASRNAFTEQAEAAGLYSEEMAEVMGMEEQYNDIQQRNLSQAAAGIYRRNYLLALLQNWSKVDEVLISQENSLGYSMKENERTMQTLNKQIEVLKASAEQLAVALGDAGLLNELKDLVEGITDAVQWFNGLDDSMQTALLTVAEVTIAVKLLDAALKMAGVSTLLSGGTKVAGLAAAGVKFSEMAKGVTSVAAAATLAKTAVSGLGKGLLGALGGPWGVAAITIGSGISYIAREANRANEELQEHATMAESLIGEYDSLTTKLNGMTKGTDEYNQAAKELSVLKSNIADSLPEVIDGYDKETGSLEINRKEMENVIKASKDLKKYKEETGDAYDNAIKKLEEERQAHEANVQKYESSQGVLNDLADRRKELTETLAKQSKGSEEAKVTQEALGETERLIADIAQEAGLKRNATVDQIMAKLKELSAAEKQASINTQIAEAEKTQAVINNSYRRLAALSAEIKANQSLLPGGSQNKYIPGFLKGKYNILPGGEFWIRKELKNDQEEAAKVNKELAKTKETYDKQLAAITESQNALNALKANAITSNAGGGAPPPSSKSGSGSSSSDWLENFIDNTLAAAEAQGVLNEASQRAIDIMDAKNAFYTDSAMTVAEYVKGMQDEANMGGVLEKQQADLHQEAELYRNAITLLEAKQKTLNTSTEEGQEAYKKIGDEIENVKQKVDELGKGWLGAETLQRGLFSKAFKEASQWVDKLVDMGSITVEDQIKLYETVDKTKLLYLDQVALKEKLVDLGKKELQQAVDLKVAALEKEKEDFKTVSDARIRALQDELDLMDEQTSELEEQRRIQEAQASIDEARADLRKAQKKLSNVQEEKNTRIFQNGVWDYIANPADIKSAQDEVEDANQKLIDAKASYYDTIEQIEEEARRKELEAQIQHEKDLQDEFVRSRDEMIKNLEADWKDLNEVKIPQNGKETNDALAKVLDDLNLTADSKFATMAQTIASYCSQMRADIRSIAEMGGFDMAGIGLPSYGIGGPIPRTGPAIVHEGEYMLNAPTVNALGGNIGVERLVASLQLPTFDLGSMGGPTTNVSNSTTKSSVKIDKSVHLHGDVNAPNVYDVSGFLRNMQQYTQR